MEMDRAQKVLAGLATFQAEGTLCDVELKAEQQTIPAHKAVLAAATPYFAAMFTGKFKETKSCVVTVKDVTFAGLKNVVECIYTTESKINAENIEDILPAAHLLQMTDIVEECTKWMSEKITKDNCFRFLRLAEKYSIDTIENAITDFVLKNFVAVSKTQGFVEISQEALIRYLSSDVLKTEMEEMHVYKAAQRWILKKKIKNKTVVFGIMKHVRFALIPPVALSEQVFTDDLIDNNKDCRKIVGEAMKYHGDLYNQPFYEGTLNRPRGKQGLLVLSNSNRKTNSFTTHKFDGMEFVSLALLDVFRKGESFTTAVVFESMKAAQIRNFLFLFGTKCDGYQNFTMRYDASNDSWMDLGAVPQVATIGSAVAYVDDTKEIFLIGGMSVNASTKFYVSANMLNCNVFRYKIQKNAWSQGISLPENLTYSGAIAFNDHIYVTGGFGTNKTTDLVYAYDLKAKLWLTKTKMNVKRCQHLLNAIKEKLYAIGGRVVDQDDDLTSVEAYDPLSNQWTVVQNDGPQADAASSVVSGSHNSIYIIGGSKTRKISLYDVEKKRTTCLTQSLSFNSRRNVSAFLTSPILL